MFFKVNHYVWLFQNKGTRNVRSIADVNSTEYNANKQPLGIYAFPSVNVYFWSGWYTFRVRWTWTMGEFHKVLVKHYFYERFQRGAYGAYLLCVFYSGL